MAAGLTTDHTRALTDVALRLQSVGYAMGLAFFGGTMLCRGAFDRALGAPAAGHRDRADDRGHRGTARTASPIPVAPPFARAVFQVLMVTGLAELALCVWLLVRHDARRWRALRETVEHRDARLPG
ncbi:MAG: hypothetical protein R2752_14275 [Vicinamibacterales bacterium]